MDQPAARRIVSFPKNIRNDTHPVEPDEELPNVVALALGDASVQIRLPLRDLADVERSLTLMRDAVQQSLTQVRAARHRGDHASLLAVRVILQQVNKLVNAKTQHRRKSAKSDR